MTAEHGMSKHLLDRWKRPLAQRTGRTEEAIVQQGLLASDFPDSGVRLVFADGSELAFRRAFCLGDAEPCAAGNISGRVAVFSAHVGGHEFWLGPADHIEVMEVEVPRKRPWADVSKACQVPDASRPAGAPPRRPDDERRMAEDGPAFQSALSSLLQDCRELAESGVHALDADEHQDAANVQIALQELGQDVSVEVAAELWRHHSGSLMACWMAGAETVASTKKTLVRYINNLLDQGR